MKRSNTVLHLTGKTSQNRLVQLPEDVWRQILCQVAALDVRGLSVVARLCRASQTWIAPQLDQLADLALSVAAYVCSRSSGGLREPNAAHMLEQLRNRVGAASPSAYAYSQQLAMFFHRQPKLCLGLLKLDEPPAALLLRVLNYAALYARYLVLPLPKQRHTKEKREQVRLINDDAPRCATRLCDVVCRASDERDAEVLPLGSFRVKCVQNAAPTEAERRKQMLRCVAGERDPLLRELLHHYVQKKGSAQERRAQYYTVTHAVRKLAKPDLEHDCFEDLVVKLEGKYVHIYSEAAAAFRARCFVAEGSRRHRRRAFYMLRYEKQHTAELRRALDQALLLKEGDDYCEIIEPSVD